MLVERELSYRSYKYTQTPHKLPTILHSKLHFYTSVCIVYMGKQDMRRYISSYWCMRNACNSCLWLKIYILYYTTRRIGCDIEGKLSIFFENFVISCTNKFSIISFFYQFASKDQMDTTNVFPIVYDDGQYVGNKTIDLFYKHSLMKHSFILYCCTKCVYLQYL